MAGPDPAAERTAMADLRHRTIALRQAIDRHKALAAELPAAFKRGPDYTGADRELFSRHEANIDSLLGCADQWDRTMQARYLPRDLRQELARGVDRTVREQAGHLRNIKEHWDYNRAYFSDLSRPVPHNRDTRSVRWYRERYPDRTPWSSGWSNVDGHVIGGILQVEALERQLALVEALLADRGSR